MRRLFAVTTGPITLLATSQAVAFLQQGGDLDALSTPFWDTSWLPTENSIFGCLLRTLVGYSANPTGAQVIAYLVVVVGMIVLMQIVGRRAELRASGIQSA
ncbi:MAG TPA: hypothetical protein VM659_03175 [Dongiaceae bacterium]|nr:hypothetical protein [Dongiaceae bacterium]